MGGGGLRDAPGPYGRGVRLLDGPLRRRPRDHSRVGRGGGGETGRERLVQGASAVVAEDGHGG
ncbi:hypothetical protein ADK41_10950 [Streptomyces caelestis]|uniref:Uncharacterized protein n=1 Tax=Streptomyces caelestis TaxID=36816 RepID=A0A0M9X9C6_9ACTN|nr:hypothetical protein ADK41_10950 [Streptomyces caelestis]